MPKPMQGTSRYMPGLDGLRAMAVLGVIAYHLNLSFAPGGLLGVGVFFVLSGYLITDLLVAEWTAHGRLDLKNFWLRRARRLLPGLLLMLIVVVAWVTLFATTELSTLRGDVLAAVLYISNWWLIFHHVSYFASFGPPSPLGHLWSLAVEEQFYLLWPLILGLTLRLTRRRGWLVGLSVIGAIASALAMAVLYQPGTDPSRVYYGTDTRAFALLIGAALAFMWPSKKLSTNISRWSRFLIDVIGTLSLLSIIYMMWKTNEYQPFLYRGGLVLLSVLTAAAVMALAHPASRLARVLGWKPLRWLGVRSYGIYLWHYPVIVLTNPAVNTSGVNVPLAVTQVVASIVLAHLSWKYIEDPIRRGELGRFFRKIRTQGLHLQLIPRRGWLVFVSLLVPLGVTCMGLVAPVSVPASTLSSVRTILPTRGVSSVTAPDASTSQLTKASGNSSPSSGSETRVISKTTTPTSTPSSGNSTGLNPGSTASGSSVSGTTNPSNTTTVGGSTSTAPPSVSQMTGPNSNRVGTGSSGSASSSQPPAANSGTSVKPQSGQGITAIGDSVMIDIAPYLKQLFPGIVVDGQVGRQMIQAPAVISQLKSQGELGNRVVIIELGTNGPFTESQLLSILKSLGPVQQIVLVNTRVPRPWQSVVNNTLAQVAAIYPHTTLVNWYAASAGKNSFFYPDGVHLNPQGAQYYANLVAEAIDSHTAP